MQAKDIFEILMREHADMLLVFLRSMVRDPAAVDVPAVLMGRALFRRRRCVYPRIARVRLD